MWDDGWWSNPVIRVNGALTGGQNLFLNIRQFRTSEAKEKKYCDVSSQGDDEIRIVQDACLYSSDSFNGLLQALGITACHVRV